MCLSVIRSQKSQQKLIDKYADEHGYLTVYKSLRQWLPKYKGEWTYRGIFFMDMGYKTGMNVSSRSNICNKRGKIYPSGFHFYISKKRAWDVSRYSCERIAVKCRVHKSWITASGNDCNGGLTIVARKAVFPSPKNEKVIVKYRGQA